MQTILDYFETIPSSYRSFILVGGISFFWLIEYSAPLFRFRYKKFKHAWPNLFFTLTTIIINFLLAFILLKTSNWAVDHKFGVLQWLVLPTWATVLLGVALLDLVSTLYSTYDKTIMDVSFGASY